jgi:hypothetical protein
VKFAVRQNDGLTQSSGRQLRDLALFDHLSEVRGHRAVVLRKLCIERPLVSLARLPGPLLAPGGLGFVHLYLGLKIGHFSPHATITNPDTNVACRRVRKDGGVEDFLQRSAPRAYHRERWNRQIVQTRPGGKQEPRVSDEDEIGWHRELMAKNRALLAELEAGNTAGGDVFPETQSEIERLKAQLAQSELIVAAYEKENPEAS